MSSTLTEAQIFTRVIEPMEADFSPEAARMILKLNFPATDVDRMNGLAAKARQGSISPGEDEELEAYIRVGHLLTILQSKARQYLKRTSGEA